MFSSSKNIESIGKLLLEFKKYLELQKEFVKLDATEKITVILSAVLVVAVLLLLGSIVLLFLTFALAYLLGEATGSLPVGFGIIAAFVLLLAFIFYMNRNRWVIQPLARFMTRLILAKEDDKP
ncbi:MAG: phage holin family protein [Paraprevotella sp.]|nr:phage holin family protein [Paraprevotella sp.]